MLFRSQLSADVIDVREVRRGDVVGYRGVAIDVDGFIVMVGCGSANGVSALSDGRSPFHFDRRRLPLIEAPHMHTSMVLVDDGGETILRPGDCAAFPKNDGDGHHIQNRSDADCAFVVIGGGQNLGGDYPDIDMRFTADGAYVHDDGTPYPVKR